MQWTCTDNAYTFTDWPVLQDNLGKPVAVSKGIMQNNNYVNLVYN